MILNFRLRGELRPVYLYIFRPQGSRPRLLQRVRPPASSGIANAFIILFLDVQPARGVCVARSYASTILRNSPLGTLSGSVSAWGWISRIHHSPDNASVTFPSNEPRKTGAERTACRTGEKPPYWRWNTSRMGNGSFLSTRSGIPPPRKQRGVEESRGISVEELERRGAKVGEQEFPPELPPPHKF